MKYSLIVAGVIVVFTLLSMGIIAFVRAVARPVPARRLADYGEFITVDGIAVHLWQKGRKHRRAVPVIDRKSVV